MINIEADVFDIISKKVRAKYTDIYMSGEYVKSPPSFPATSLEEVDNQTYESTQTNSEFDNHAYIMYEVNTYSNKVKGKKSECKAIMALIDEEMTALGFTRTTMRPIPNMDDATIYRMVARYKAVVSRNKTIYRR